MTAEQKNVFWEVIEDRYLTWPTKAMLLRASPFTRDGYKDRATNF
jgi:hypothetical protein